MRKYIQDYYGKSNIQQKEDTSHQQIGLASKEEINKALRMELKFGHCGKQIRNTREVLKCGAGEGWRSVGPIFH